MRISLGLRCMRYTTNSPPSHGSSTEKPVGDVDGVAMMDAWFSGGGYELVGLHYKDEGSWVEGPSDVSIWRPEQSRTREGGAHSGNPTDRRREAEIECVSETAGGRERGTHRGRGRDSARARGRDACTLPTHANQTSA